MFGLRVDSEGLGAGPGGRVQSNPIDSKFRFHGKFWINLKNLGHFSLYFSSLQQVRCM